MRVRKWKASLFIGLRELASLEITQSRARRQTLRVSKPGFSVSRFQGCRVSRHLKPGSSQATSPDRAARYSSSSPTLQQQNHLVCADSYLRTEHNNFGDRALQRFFLRNGEGLSHI